MDSSSPQVIPGARLDPLSLPRAGIRTEPEALAPWKGTDELLRSAGHKGCRVPKTLISGDGPSEACLPHVPISPRAGLHSRESPALLQRARSAGAVGRGVFTGSAVEPPPPVSPRLLHLPDSWHPAARSSDAASVESAHARALAAEGPAAFRLSSGFGAEYMNAGVPLRSVTPLWSAHLRLTTLEDTLGSMQLAGAAGEEGEEQGGLLAGQPGRPLWSRVGSGTFHYTPLPSAMVPPGTPRRVHTPGSTTKQPRAGGTGGTGTTNLLEDASAQAALRWAPQAAPGEPPSAAATALLSALPPPLPLLAVTCPNPSTFVSRASRGAVSPRGRASKLDAVMERFLGERAVGGGEGGSVGGGGLLGTTTPRAGTPSASSPRGSGFALLPPPSSPLSHHSARHAAAHRASTPGDAARAAAAAAAGLPHPGKQPSSSSPPRSPRSPRSTPLTDSAGDSSLSTSSTSSSSSSSIHSLLSLTAQRKAGGGLHSSEILVGPASARTAAGVLAGVTRASQHASVAGLRSNPGLVRMRSGAEVLSLAAVQARAMYRLHAAHDTDLTHGFIEEGVWAAMNFGGRTQSPRRYVQAPRPLGGGGGGSLRRGSTGGFEVVAQTEEEGEEGGSSRTQRFVLPPHAQAAATASSGGSAEAVAVSLQATALGRAMQSVHAGVLAGEGEGGYYASYARESARTRAAAGSSGSSGSGSGGTPPLAPPPQPPQQQEASAVEGAAAVSALGQWESAHEGLLQDPGAWPKRKLRDKVRESGVAHLLGLGDEGALQGASKQALLSAFKRIGATRRMQDIYAGGRGWARGEKA